MNLEGAVIEQHEQAFLRQDRALNLTTAFAVQFGRIDVRDPDLLAGVPEGVAVNHAVVAGAGGAERKSGGSHKQRHRSQLWRSWAKVQARSPVEGGPMDGFPPAIVSALHENGRPKSVRGRTRKKMQLSPRIGITGVNRALSRPGLSIWPPGWGKGRTIYHNRKTAGTEEALYLDAQRQVAGLESREREVLESIVEGHSLIRIAGQLGVSQEDAVRLKASLMSKLGANVTADLVRIGIYAQADRGH